ncbi:MAG: TonB-dependent receptor plug domain-containing protein [Flavobacteriaceae bacterium]|nr:TonB-dependent receptor plug domain-containing protein [Flavobacteriaceae bacterium]MCY4217222.1 TonB-dependent receptor plug domain-containing protein [Flavobacteriaceae bacterium]
MKWKFWKSVFFVFIVMATPSIGLAQANTVTGTVTDYSDGIPLLGASVVVLETNLGVATDSDGNFTVEAQEGQILLVSCFGFITQEIVVGEASYYDVNLISDQWDEVEATSLEVTRQKRELTYATQNVNTLQGKVTRSSQSLYIVDGIPLDGPVSDLSPENIASISILRGSNAIALYGARANNGIIIITTKSGEVGRNADDKGIPITETIDSWESKLDSDLKHLPPSSEISSSQPLYIVDGIPLDGPVSDLSPENIASISILRGSNAIALYGARANNGIIIITTKSGEMKKS